MRERLPLKISSIPILFELSEVLIVKNPGSKSWPSVRPTDRNASQAADAVTYTMTVRHGTI
jgi:hypothetical protein